MSKVSKKQAGYIDPPPRSMWPPSGRGIRCGTCSFFGGIRGPHSYHCSKVKGTIQPQSCCNLWSHDGSLDVSFSCGKDIEDVIG